MLWQGEAVVKQTEVTLRVNKKERQATVAPRLLLSDFLRHNLHLHGTHVGCEHGVCGACTIIVDGSAVRSCLMFAVQADGCEVTTVESLGSINKLHPLQQAFWEEHGLQCGFCTPGMLMVAIELLSKNPNPTEDEIREAISGNLCRCTGYQNIVKSIASAAKKMRAVTEAAASRAISKTTSSRRLGNAKKRVVI
jgi:carbon-monoxide dehydrogenase small subunit